MPAGRGRPKLGTAVTDMGATGDFQMAHIVAVGAGIGGMPEHKP